MLTIVDPDAPSGSWVHWVLANLPPGTANLQPGELPDGVVQGRNSWGADHYDGPQPPSGTHRYVIMLYAVDRRLDLQQGFDLGQLATAIQGHVLAKAKLEGTFSK